MKKKRYKLPKYRLGTTIRDDIAQFKTDWKEQRGNVLRDLGNAGLDYATSAWGLDVIPDDAYKTQAFKNILPTMDAVNSVQRFAGRTIVPAAVGAATGNPMAGRAVGMAMDNINAATQEDEGLPQSDIQSFARGGISVPNAEVEGGEVLKYPSGKMKNINGPSHEQGGVQITLPEGTKIFSDDPTMKTPEGKTIASEAKRLNKAKEKYEKALLNKSGIEKNTAAIMLKSIEKQINDLFNYQESLKNPAQGVSQQRQATISPQMMQSTGEDLNASEGLENGQVVLPNQNNEVMNTYRQGGIYIKPSKRGTFTAAATKHGATVQGFASRVLANKSKYSKAMIKKAVFAKNAAKWKHQHGGKQPPTPYRPSYQSGFVPYSLQKPVYISRNNVMASSGLANPETGYPLWMLRKQTAIEPMSIVDQIATYGSANVQADPFGRLGYKPVQVADGVTTQPGTIPVDNPILTTESGTGKTSGVNKVPSYPTATVDNTEQPVTTTPVVTDGEFVPGVTPMDKIAVNQSDNSLPIAQTVANPKLREHNIFNDSNINNLTLKRISPTLKKALPYAQYIPRAIHAFQKTTYPVGREVKEIAPKHYRDDDTQRRIRESAIAAGRKVRSNYAPMTRAARLGINASEQGAINAEAQRLSNINTQVDNRQKGINAGIRLQNAKIDMQNQTFKEMAKAAKDQYIDSLFSDIARDYNMGELENMKASRDKEMITLILEQAFLPIGTKKEIVDLLKQANQYSDSDIKDFESILNK